MEVLQKRLQSLKMAVKEVSLTSVYDFLDIVSMGKNMLAQIAGGLPGIDEAMSFAQVYFSHYMPSYPKSQGIPPTCFPV